MKIRLIILLLAVLFKISNAQTPTSSLCNLDTVFSANLYDKELVRMLLDNSLSEKECSELRYRLSTINWGDDSLKAVTLLKGLESAGNLYTSEGAGEESEQAYTLMLEKMKQGDYLTAYKVSIAAGYFRTNFIRAQQRIFSSRLAAIRNAVAYDELSFAGALIDTTEMLLKKSPRGILFNDSLANIKEQYTARKNREELADRLYNEVEESNTTYSISFVFSPLFIPEINDIEWTVNTVQPNSRLNVSGARTQSKIILPIGFRFGHALMENTFLEFELLFSRDRQESFQFGPSSISAGYHRTFISAELDGKYLFRTNYGLRPYVMMGFAVLHLQRSEFHPHRKFFDPYFSVHSNLTPPIDFIISEERRTTSAICFELGDNVLLSTSGGWFVDIFFGFRVVNNAPNYFTHYVYSTGIRSGLMW